MVFRERALAESLVDFSWRVSVDGISIDVFCEDVSHGGLKRLGFGIFLGRSRDALAARNMFQTAAFFLYQGVYCKWSGGGMGRGSTASGGGWWWSLLLAEQRECYVELVTER